MPGPYTFSLALTATAAAGTPIDVVRAGPYHFGASLSASLGASFVYSPAGPYRFSAKLSARAFLPRPYGIDVTTGRPAYRVVLLSAATGLAFGEIPAAKLGPVSDMLNGDGGFDFSLASVDPHAADCKPGATEVQVWRGGQLEWWGVIVRASDEASDDGQTVKVQAAGLMWYLSRRTIGTDATNLLTNGDFEQGVAGWSFGFLPDSIPAAPPEYSLSSDSLTGSRSLSIAGSSAVQVSNLSADVLFYPDEARLLPGGEDAILAECAKMGNPAGIVKVTGHTQFRDWQPGNQLSTARANMVRDIIAGHTTGATITAVGVGNTQPRPDYAPGTKEQRFVGIEYTRSAYGNKQYAAQSLTYANAESRRKSRLTLVGWYKVTAWTDPGIGYGAYLDTVDGGGQVIAADTFKIDATTPRDAWIRQECSVEVEAGATVTVNVRLHPPSGTVLWDTVALTEDRTSSWWDTDQASIVAGLVAQAQSTALGKSDLRLSSRCLPTGVLRTRHYPWAERIPTDRAIGDLMTLADGMDVSLEVTPTTRTVVTHYPRKGADLAYTLALGSNVLGYSLQVDGEQTATTVVVQSTSGSGSGREEGVYRDASRLGGLVLESVYSAPAEMSVGALRAQARRGWDRYSAPVQALEVTMAPSFTSELLTNVAVGDRVPVVIGRGLALSGRYRITAQHLDPNTDQLTYTLAQEV